MFRNNARNTKAQGCCKLEDAGLPVLLCIAKPISLLKTDNLRKFAYLTAAAHMEKPIALWRKALQHDKKAFELFCYASMKESRLGFQYRNTAVAAKHGEDSIMLWSYFFPSDIDAFE